MPAVHGSIPLFQPIPALHIELIRYLKKRGRVGLQFLHPRIRFTNPAHLLVFGVAFEVFQLPIEAEHHQTPVRIDANRAIVMHQTSTGHFRPLQQIPAKKSALVWSANQPEERRTQVQLTSQRRDPFGCWRNRRSKNNGRNLITAYRDGLAAIDSRSMVCNHGKDGVGPEGFLAHLIKKAPQRVVGIFHGVIPFPRERILRDSAGGISVGFVVGDRHGGDKERQSTPMSFPGLLDDPIV